MKFWYALIAVARMLTKVIGLTILTSCALAISVLINSIALAYPHLWVLAPGLHALSSRATHLAALSHFLGLGWG